MISQTENKFQPKPAFWRSFPIFEDADPDSLAELSAVAVRRDWPTGTVLFQRGDPGDYLVALADGMVKLSVSTPQGRELVLHHADAGSILGELTLFDEEPRSADATTIEPTTGYIVRRTDFQAIVARHPDLMAASVRFLCRRLRDTNDKLESIALYALEARVARFLLFTLRNIHGDDLPPNPSLRLYINQTELASVLGASRPKVNRSLQNLTEAGAIQRDGDILVCDTAILRAMADPLDD
jgi:CRP/FNR family cyclic AMP-dependent transcriptional regulator